MKKSINLLEGPILPSLSGLALPIMATSLIQMAYNLTDMIWIGRVGSSAVAAVGAAGMYMWLANGLATLAKMGGQVKVAQALGAKENSCRNVYVAGKRTRYTGENGRSGKSGTGFGGKRK
nr:matE: MATE efflux family [uncultured bacterium]